MRSLGLVLLVFVSGCCSHPKTDRTNPPSLPVRVKVSNNIPKRSFFNVVSQQPQNRILVLDLPKENLNNSIKSTSDLNKYTWTQEYSITKSSPVEIKYELQVPFSGNMFFLIE